MNQDPNLTDPGSKLDETSEETEKRIRFHPDNYWTLRNKLIVITTAISTAGLLVSLFSLYLTLSFAESQRNLREQDNTIQANQRQKDLGRQEELRNQDFERQRSLKETDLRQYSQRRYDDLAYETRARVKSRRDAKGYYKRFWDLQFEQYQYCKDGLIDREIFTTWMASRRVEYDENQPVGKLSYQAGWKYMSDWFTKHDYDKPGHYTEFVSFMNDVFHGKKATCDLKPSKP